MRSLVWPSHPLLPFNSFLFPNGMWMNCHISHPFYHLLTAFVQSEHANMQWWEIYSPCSNLSLWVYIHFPPCRISKLFPMEYSIPSSISLFSLHEHAKATKNLDSHSAILPAAFNQFPKFYWWHQEWWQWHGSHVTRWDDPLVECCYHQWWQHFFPCWEACYLCCCHLA